MNHFTLAAPGSLAKLVDFNTVIHGHKQDLSLGCVYIV